MGCASSKQKSKKKNLEQQSIFFVLGRSGAGKGTILQRYVKENSNYVHISMGDVLRAEIERGSDDAKMIEETIKEGGCLQFNEFWSIVEREIQAKAGTGKYVFLDGFPRSEQNNAEWWDT